MLGHKPIIKELENLSSEPVLPPNSPEYAADIGATECSNAPTIPLKEKEAFTESMLNVLMPSRAETLAKAVAKGNIEIRQRKKGHDMMACTRLPPSHIEPRGSNILIVVGKTIWVIYPDEPDVVTAAGKIGVSWKCKSSKLGPECKKRT